MWSRRSCGLAKEMVAFCGEEAEGLTRGRASALVRVALPEEVPVELLPLSERLVSRLIELRGDLPQEDTGF